MLNKKISQKIACGQVENCSVFWGKFILETLILTSYKPGEGPPGFLPVLEGGISVYAVALLIYCGTISAER